MSQTKEHLQVNVPQAKKMIAQCVRAGLVPMIQGSPGLGKSAAVKQVADEFGLEVIDVRLSQCDPTDLMGFPSVKTLKDDDGTDLIDKDGYAVRVAEYVPMATFPTEDTPLPKGKNGWILFLDEFNSASMSVQAAAYKIVLDQEVGPHKLHPKCAVICAGNLATDGAIVNRQSTAMQSRLLHMFLGIDFKAWNEWATFAKQDHRVLSYLRFKPSELYNFKADHDDVTFRCPRTWEFMSNLLTSGVAPTHDNIQLLSGTIGEAGARQFVAYCKIYEDLVTVEQILTNPAKAHVPEEKSTLFALTGSIAAHAEAKNLDGLMQYVNRIPKEFQVITVQDMVAKDPLLVSQKCLSDWITTNGEELFGV